jgi:hypothetical protein
VKAGVGDRSEKILISNQKYESIIGRHKGDNIDGQPEDVCRRYVTKTKT